MRDNNTTGKDGDSGVGLIVIVPSVAGTSVREIDKVLAEPAAPPPGACRDEEDSVRFRELLRGIIDGVFVADLDGRITAANRLDRIRKLLYSG